MSDQVVTEISVNVGEVPNSPGFKVAARLGFGVTNSGNIKNTFNEKACQELNDLSLYIVIPARSTEGAEEIRETVHNSIEKFKSDEELDGKVAKLRELVAKSDDEDFEGKPKFVWTVEVYGNNVVVKATPIAQMREMVSVQLEMATGIAGDILGKNQEIYFELDSGKDISELVSSENWVKDIFEAFCFKLWVHLDPNLFKDLSELAPKFDFFPSFVMFLGSMSLYKSGTLNINFKSSNELPDSIKEGLAKLSANSMPPNIHNDIPENTKKFFGHFANAGSGNLHIFTGYQTNALHLDLHLPGLSKFLAQ